MPTTASDAALSAAELPGPDRHLPFYGLAVTPVSVGRRPGASLARQSASGHPRHSGARVPGRERHRGPYRGRGHGEDEPRAAVHRDARPGRDRGGPGVESGTSAVRFLRGRPQRLWRAASRARQGHLRGVHPERPGSGRGARRQGAARPGRGPGAGPRALARGRGSFGAGRGVRASPLHPARRRDPVDRGAEGRPARRPASSTSSPGAPYPRSVSTRSAPTSGTISTRRAPSPRSSARRPSGRWPRSPGARRAPSISSATARCWSAARGGRDRSPRPS